MRLAIVTENLVYQRVTPPMIHVLISPGEGMRGRQYGMISDRYVRYLLEEVLPEINKTDRLRTDGYSRAIGGLSADGGYLYPIKVRREQPRKNLASGCPAAPTTMKPPVPVFRSKIFSWRRR